MTDEQIMQRLEFKRGEQCADKERAYNEEYCLRKELKTELKTTKSEAIEEFAERLKEYSFVDNLSLDGKEAVYVDEIDNLVKEMTEVEE